MPSARTEADQRDVAQLAVAVWSGGHDDHLGQRGRGCERRCQALQPCGVRVAQGVVQDHRHPHVAGGSVGVDQDGAGEVRTTTSTLGTNPLGWGGLRL